MILQRGRGPEFHFSSLLVEGMVRAVVRKRGSSAVCCRRWGFSVRHTDARKGKAGGNGRRESASRFREKRARTREAPARDRGFARAVGRAVGEISRWVGLINYYNEFHITIGVVKLRMVRVDPGSWVVHVQHGVRLASALRAVAQG